MNKYIIFILLFFIVPLFAFSQFTFSGGNGDENDPYVISTLQDLKDFKLVTRSGNADINSYYSHSNYILSNDISIPNAEIEEIQAGVLYGHFNGKGHSLVFIADGSDLTGFNQDPRHLIGQLGGTVDSLVMSGEIYHSFLLVREILDGGKISNCINYSYSQLLPIYSDSIMTSFVSARFTDANSGIIENCINYADVYASSVCGGVICLWCCNGGVVRNCKNFGSIYNAVVAAGICGCLFGDAVIENCINYGNIYTRNQNEIAQIMNAHQYEDFSVGGIVAYAETSNNTIRNCQNYGTIVSEKFHTVGGIYGGNRYYPNQANVNVENCANYGHLYNGGIIGGIVGNTFGTVTVRNCYNAGDVYGYGSILSSEHASSTSEIRNCLSVYGRSQMVRATDDGDFTMASNYYDRQMVNDTIEDIAGQEEGHITSQLVGDTPELRAMLGDGWSYAEGRYPIPLGLENDSLAMLFATPIYLYAESNEEYDNVDLVQHHFTVGTENGVSWASGSRLNIVGENATILASGSENITASLAGYSFTRRLNLINPVNIEEQDFDDVKVFPNPTNDILNITASETISEIEIVNVMGLVVYRIEVNSDNAVCDVDDLRSGVYVVRIRHFDTSTNSVHRKLSVRKFVKE